MADDDNDYDFGADISLDPADVAKVKSNQKDWYKAEKGRVDRIAFVYFYRANEIAVHRALGEAAAKKEQLSAEDRNKIGNAALAKHAEKLGKPVGSLSSVDRLSLDDIRFKRYMVHYADGFGYVESRLGMDGADADDIWRRLGEAKEYFVSLLLVYPTMHNGDLIKERLKDGWSIKPWKFGPERMRQIIKRNKSLAENGILLSGQDIELTCKDTTYQNVELNPIGPALYRKHPSLQEMVLSKALDFYNKLSPAREMTTADVRSKLGLGGSSSSSIASSDDFSGILENV